MTNEDAERGRLGRVCGDLLGRSSGDIFTRQVSRVLAHILCARTESVQSPLDVAATFRRKGLIPPTIVHIVRWHKEISPGEALPTEAAVAVIFAACLYPRRLTDQERVTRFQRFMELYRVPNIGDFNGILTRVDAVGRLPEGVTRAQLVGMLGDMCAADQTADKQERSDRLIGAALHFATHHAATTDRQAGAEKPLGIHQYWSDDGEFVGFLRANFQHLPSISSHAMIKPAANGEPSWNGIQSALVKELGECHLSFIKKAVQLEQMLWRRRTPDRITPEDFASLAADFWENQCRNLICGFPYFAFESHFVRWWQACVINLRNLILRTPRGSAVRLPEPCQAEATRIKKIQRRWDKEEQKKELQKREEEARKSVLTPEFLWTMREGWRLVRSTFCRVGAANPAVENEAFRRGLDELWQYHLEKDICQSKPSEKVNQIAIRCGLELNAAFTYIKRICNRHMAYRLARHERMTNYEIKNRLAETHVEIQPLHLDLASIARAIDCDDTLFFAFVGYVFFHVQIDPAHRDPWDFGRLREEFHHWAADHLFVRSLCRKAINGIHPHRHFLAALLKLLGEPLSSLSDACTDDHVDMLQSHILRALEKTDAAWATGLARDVMGSSGISLYRDLRSIFTLDRHSRENHSEWIIPSVHLGFVEQLPLQTKVLVERLRVDEQDEINIHMVVQRLRSYRDKHEEQQ